MVQGLSLEQWGLLASLLIGAGALYYANRATRVSVKQLELAREEALRHPNLEVCGVTVANAEGFEELAETRAAQKAWQEARESEEQEDFVGALLDDENSSFTLEQALYEGPYPGLVLTFELRNRGNRAASEVSGKVAVDPNLLEPLKFPGFNGSNLNEQEGTIRLSVGAVPPARSGEVVIYRIALLKVGSGRTIARTVFSTPEGDHWEEELELEIP